MQSKTERRALKPRAPLVIDDESILHESIFYVTEPIGEVYFLSWPRPQKNEVDSSNCFNVWHFPKIIIHF